MKTQKQLKKANDVALATNAAQAKVERGGKSVNFALPCIVGAVAGRGEASEAEALGSFSAPPWGT